MQAKKAIIILMVLLLAYAAYVTADCIRLRKAPSDTKPLITVSEPEYEKGTKYIGLGYSIAYYREAVTDENGNTAVSGYGAEFRLFDSVLVWAWIE